MNHLWQKESPSHDATFVDIFKCIESKPISSGIGDRKYNEISTRLRNKGNEYFQQHRWYDAMRYYNKSLCFAEVGSENVSFAYANRATCFLYTKQFDKCLLDIELAKQAGYPNNLMAKLENRKIKCMKTMEQVQPEYSPIERELSFKSNVNFPCLADVVDIQRNDEFGRHIVAKCDLAVGETILVEKSFVSTTLSGPLSSCAKCQKTRMNFIACENCTLVMFCDENCKADYVLHKYDCNFIYDCEQMENGHLQSVAQTIFFGLNVFKNVDMLIQFVEAAMKDAKDNTFLPETINDASSIYHLFLTLFTYRDEMGMNKLIVAKKIYTILLQLPAINCAFNTESKQRFLMHLVVKHNEIINKNSTRSLQNEVQCIRKLGLVSSLFNHSCAPNLLNIADDDKKICITMRPVKKGQQLFVSYLNVNDAMNQRQNYLMKQFGFLCHCDKSEPTYSPVDADQMLTEPDYQFLQRNCNANFMNDRIRLDIERKSCKLLNRYGHLWTSELQLVLNMYSQSKLYE